MNRNAGRLSSIKIRRTLSACAVGILLGSYASAYAAKWTQVTNLAPSLDAPPSATGTMLLLTDGTVMVQGNPLNTWMRLTPSAKGSYADGTWSSLASMSTARLYFASHILPSGKVWILGGEYSGAYLQQNITNTGEIYDPVSNTWAPIAHHPDASFGDDPSMLVSGGQILAGSIFTNKTYLYDIASNTWSDGGTKVHLDRSDEESWAKVPGGNVVTYDIFESVDHSGQYAETYNPATNTWASISPSDGTALGSIPALSSVALGYELGPLVRVRGYGSQGQIFAIGATGHTALYSPATNTWTPGPDITDTLNGNSAFFGAADAPAAVMPNGHVLLAADASPTSGLFSAPTRIFDFDPVANTITPVSPAPADPRLATTPSYFMRMLMLPTGEVLFSDKSRQLWIYTPDGNPQPSWRPVFANVKYSGGGVFTLQGVRMNGQSAGSAYGDDVETDENYPIVQLQDASGNVFYARTMNWSTTSLGNTGGETVDFTLKPGMAPGNYSAVVIGAGISSQPRCMSITAGQIQGTAAAANGALTCKGPK